ncbi:uncharacterized protein LOC121419171 [Lytechinus variegatus]|uniref:uncharacterized protein LOC121419171 n=1 Tax=Lytechinus variegatus TaxID=7654 RepID=UPI001BB22E58|nr:uncharacterized protein LOC121419171 [Lytechinus variegatus]
MPGQINLQWTTDSENNSSVYILEKSPFDDSTVWHLVLMTKEISYTLTQDYICGDTYSVVEVSLHGVSRYSNSFTPSRTQILPSVERSTLVHNVDHNDDNATITFSWQDPPGWDDAITSYTALFSFNKGLSGSSHHHHDYEIKVNVTSVSLTVPINSTEDNLTFQLYGTHGCLETIKTTHFFKNVLKRKELRVVKKRLSAINVTEVASLSSDGFFYADIKWSSLPDFHHGLQYYYLYYGEMEKLGSFLYFYLQNTKKTVKILANATEFRMTDLKPETEYGLEIIGYYYTYEDEHDARSIGRHPNIRFTTGVLPTMSSTRMHNTEGSYVVTIPYPPTRLPFHKLSLYIVGPLALVLIMVFLICCGTCAYRRQRSISKANLSRDEESIPNIYSSPSYPALLSTSQVKPDVMDRWEISPARIKVGDVLGEGAFGQVLKGLVVGRIWSHQSSLSAIVPREATHGEHTVVAVKMLHKFAEDTQKQEFLREIELMKELGYHPNVVSLLGCCTIQDPICLLVEHCYYGDLLHFLRIRRPQMFDQFKTGRAPRTPCKDTLRPLDLLSFARQIAMGMEYISQKGFVHRDLAARNVMVADDKNVKIGDFGLTRYVYDDKVYVNRRGGKLPVKWMSLEAIYDQIFTTKGDVWSYGVVLFEIVTLGAAPYPGISNKDMPKLLKGGYRMEKPENCSPQIFSLMEATWCDDPELRPGFTELRNKLEEMMEENVCYMEFDAEKQQCYCYEDSSSDDDSEDLNVEESPMLEAANEDTVQDSLLATPMLKIPTGVALQSRSTQNLSLVSPCKRMMPVSLSLTSLNHQKQIPPSWIPQDLFPFGRSVDNRAYYAGHPKTDDHITHSAIQIQETQHDTNPYSGITGSLENMHSNKENPILAELNLECPHPVGFRLFNNESNKDKSSESVESSNDSCLCDDISDEERHHMIKDFNRSDTFDTSDLSPDTDKYPSLIALKRFAEGKVLISPTSLDSGVSCDMTTGRLLLEGCRETVLCSDEDLSE